MHLMQAAQSRELERPYFNELDEIVSPSLSFLFLDSCLESIDTLAFLQARHTLSADVVVVESS